VKYLTRLNSRVTKNQINKFYQSDRIKRITSKETIRRGETPSFQVQALEKVELPLCAPLVGVARLVPASDGIDVVLISVRLMLLPIDTVVWGELVALAVGAGSIVSENK